MSWNVTKKVKTIGEIEEMKPDYDIREGATKQLESARIAAIHLQENVRGDEFYVSLSGHSQTDDPGSAPDSISVSISAVS